MKDIEEKLSNLDKRLRELEKVVFSKDKKIDWNPNDFKGLRGGMRLLIKNGFFDSPKPLQEIGNELKREGYHYPKPSVSKALSVDFTNKQKILNRIKGEEQWMYVLRK